MPVTFPVLEVHVANACNLTCESCSHFSNNGHKGVLSLEEFEAWCAPWTSKIQPISFRMLGGEPTVNPHMTDILLRARELWPSSQLVITTNGFFLHRHPRLAEALAKTKTVLVLTQHDDSPEYIQKWQKARSLLDEWQKDYHFTVYDRESYKNWTRRYTGFGSEVMPFADNNPSESWNNCQARMCVQLFRGKIWKCSPIAYLQLQKEQYPAISPEWDPYLAYRPLEPTADANEIASFLSRKAESICNMCPAKPELFVKPSPLIPIKDLLNKRMSA